jgi:hypothetical protein
MTSSLFYPIPGKYRNSLHPLLQSDIACKRASQKVLKGLIRAKAGEGPQVPPTSKRYVSYDVQLMLISRCVAARNELRMLHLVYGFLRGKSYEKMMPNTRHRWNPADVQMFRHVLHAYQPRPCRYTITDTGALSYNIFSKYRRQVRDTLSQMDADLEAWMDASSAYHSQLDAMREHEKEAIC